MRFFVPGEPDAAKAEGIYAAIKKFASQVTSADVSDRRIFRITFLEDRKTVQAEVGKRDPIDGMTVFAILEYGSFYLVCTLNRGVRSFKDGPLIVGKDEVSSAEVFDT